MRVSIIIKINKRKVEIMKFSMFSLVIVMLVSFSTQSFAANVDEWVYENITGDLKPTAGCKVKEKAAKQASSGYRFKKYSTIMCQSKGYGWGLEEVTDKGELVCEACEGDYEGAEKYRCYMKDVKAKCRQVAR